MARSSSKLLQIVLSRVFPRLIAFAIVVMACPPASLAQQEQKIAVEGYITAVHPPTGFDVNGEHVAISAETRYGYIARKEGGNESASADAVRVGAYVQVMGLHDKSAKSVTASGVYFRDTWDKKLSGMGVIDKVISTEQEPVFQADGYRIRIPAGAEVSFSGDLKTLADVGTNTWVKYEGKQDKTGLLIATKVKFISLKTPKAKKQPDTQNQPNAPAKADAKKQHEITQDSLLDAEGNVLSLRTKVRYSNAGGWCGWHKVLADQTLQERVLRVGMKLVPEFQKQMANDQPLKIPFRFYVVDEAQIRSEVVCNPGLILVPRQVLERLKNDDQLAAVISDGVAFNLQVYAPKLMAELWGLTGVELAAVAASRFVPGVSLGTEIGAGIVEYRLLVQMEEQRGRMALTLMADAGYDPWQAPEAWRLLAPKKLPADLNSLKYPNRSGYQLGILNLQYRPAGDAAGPAKSQ
jgi:hypothetical protein